VCVVNEAELEPPLPPATFLKNYLARYYFLARRVGDDGVYVRR
jgi:hypothetical protein